MSGTSIAIDGNSNQSNLVLNSNSAAINDAKEIKDANSVKYPLSKPNSFTGDNLAWNNNDTLSAMLSGYGFITEKGFVAMMIDNTSMHTGDEIVLALYRETLNVNDLPSHFLEEDNANLLVTDYVPWNGLLHAAFWTRLIKEGYVRKTWTLSNPDPNGVFSGFLYEYIGSKVPTYEDAKKLTCGDPLVKAGYRLPMVMRGDVFMPSAAMLA